jgi:hypothetical protein
MSRQDAADPHRGGTTHGSVDLDIEHGTIHTSSMNALRCERAMTLLDEPSVESHDHTEVLFQEAKQRRRRRWLLSGLAMGVVLVVLGVVAGFVWSRGGGPPAQTIRVPAPPVVANASPVCSVHSAFELSLAHGYGGQPSPVKAAEWFARHGGVASIPSDGWHETNRNGQGATVYSGETRLSLVQGSDGTWQVDGAMPCT